MKFIWIIGPQAVGKMTVGKLLAKTTGYKFFHNHQSIELALQYFDYGSDPFKQINGSIRKVIFDTIAKYEEVGFIFTVVVDFSSESDIRWVENVNTIFEQHGWDIYYIELEADLATRLERNSHPDRLAAKPSKQDQEATKERMIESMNTHQLNSHGNFPLDSEHHLVINNEDLDPRDVVTRIMEFCVIDSID